MHYLVVTKTTIYIFSKISFFITDPEIKSSGFWHIFENRAQNPENQPTSKCCRNRASWRIPSKPSPNERSRFSFSKKNYFRWFFDVLYIFEHRPDPDFRKSRKIPDLVKFWAFIQVAELIFFKKCFSHLFPLDQT